MVLEHFWCLLLEESSNKSKIISHKSTQQKVYKEVHNVFWLPFIKLILNNCTYRQKATDEKESSGNWPNSKFLDTIKVHSN
jgi:hypothetical protein